MKQFIEERPFKKGLKKLKKSGDKQGISNLSEFINLLKIGSELPEKYNLHALHGRQKGLYSVWIKGTQWVLVMEISETYVRFLCLGSHKECYESVD